MGFTVKAEQAVSRVTRYRLLDLNELPITRMLYYDQDMLAVPSVVDQIIRSLQTYCS
jgi:hypothetical protein